MSRTIDTFVLCKDEILKRISEIDIFSAYLNIDNATIINCIQQGDLIQSPIRIDNNPTCGFRYDKRGRLKMRDFAGYFWGDCFDIVALILSKKDNIIYDVSNKEHFKKILLHITYTFRNIFYGMTRDYSISMEIEDSLKRIKNEKPIIEVVVRQWNQQDIDYWKQFGISIKDLNINFIYPIEQYYINRYSNPRPKYIYEYKDPCYAYYLGRSNVEHIKLYFPKRTKVNVRFITNSNHLEGILNLTEDNYDYIIVTKSTKDRVALTSYLGKGLHIPLTGLLKVGVINIPHESYKLKQTEYDWLKSKLNYSGRLLSLMDNDKAGIKQSIWLKNSFGLIPTFVNKEYGKDFAELIQNKGIDFVSSQIEILIEIIKEYEESEYNGYKSSIPIV